MHHWQPERSRVTNKLYNNFISVPATVESSKAITRRKTMVVESPMVAAAFDLCHW